MKHRTQLIATAGLFAIALSFAALVAKGEPREAMGEPRTIAAVPAPGIYGGSEEQRATVRKAIELFHRAKLELPDLRIYIHDDIEGCGGFNGRFNLKGDPFRVDICHPGIRLALHELAHAWEYHNVDDATRSAYMAFAGSLSWNNWDHYHGFRGVEQAAWAIVWGVTDTPLQALALLSDTERMEAEAFEILTGMPSPRIDHLSDQAVIAAATTRPSIQVEDLASNRR